MLDAVPESDPARAPRYLRFVTALVLGTAAAAGLAACRDDENIPDDAPVAIDAVDTAIDATDTPIDTPIDMGAVVDGPLPPPDLPRSVA